MSDIVKKQIEAYQTNFIANNNSPRGTFQNNITTQHERFNQLISPLLPFRANGFSICDVGSGTGDLHQYLLDRGIAHDYKGIEIVPEMVDYSLNKYPDIEIFNVDLLSYQFDRKFDFVVLSGTFNIPGGVLEDQWKDFIFSAIKRMFELCNTGISFNALTTYSTFSASELFYLDPAEVLSYIQSHISRFCYINTAYPLYEVSYSVFKPEAIRDRFKHADFDKYFTHAGEADIR